MGTNNNYGFSSSPTTTTAEQYTAQNNAEMQNAEDLHNAKMAAQLAATQQEIELFNKAQEIQSQHRAELAGLNNQLLGIQHADKMRTLMSEVNQALISNAWTRIKHVASNMKY